MTNTMINGAFVLKMKTPSWRLCVVKQAPDQPASSWMLFGQPKCNKSKSTFQMEFQSHQETILIKHLVKLASFVDDSYAELRLVLVAESPAISCIESLWSLKGVEIYRTKPSSLCTALHHDVHMLSLSPQIAQPEQSSQPPNQSQTNQSQTNQSQTNQSQTNQKAQTKRHKLKGTN